MSIAAFRDEWLKIAALTEPEQASLHDAVKRHAEFDQMAGKGNMSAEHQAAMRHNVDRIKHFKSKKKDDNYSIPSWAHDRTGKPPSNTRPPPPPRSSYQDSPKSSYGSGASGGGYSGSSGSHWDSYQQAENHKRRTKFEDDFGGGMPHSSDHEKRTQSTDEWYNNFNKRRDAHRAQDQAQRTKDYARRKAETEAGWAAHDAQQAARAKARPQYSSHYSTPHYSAPSSHGSTPNYHGGSRALNVVSGLASAATAGLGGLALYHVYQDAKHRADRDRKKKSRMAKAAEVSGLGSLAKPSAGGR